MDKPTLVELFSGSKNVSGVWQKLGGKVLSVDINKKLSPSICCNILDLSRDQLPKSVDFFWISVPCLQFSRAGDSSHWHKRVVKYRVYDYRPISEAARNAVALLQKSVDILRWFPDIPFVIENPVGRIHHLGPMKQLGHFRYFVNYFDFGFSYSKETYLFTNIYLPFSTKKYPVKAPGMRTVRNRFERSKVPPNLAELIFKYYFNGENSIR